MQLSGCVTWRNDIGWRKRNVQLNVMTGVAAKMSA